MNELHDILVMVAGVLKDNPMRVLATACAVTLFIAVMKDALDRARAERQLKPAENRDRPTRQ